MYEVQAEDQSGPRRTLHRNLLLPCDLLPLETPLPALKDTKLADPAPDPVHRDPTDEEDENSSSDSEDEQDPAQVQTTVQARNRRPPRRITYDTLGTPRFQRPVVATVTLPMTLPWSNYTPFVFLG